MSETMIPTTNEIHTLLAWYEALPQTPDRASDQDRTAVRWLLDRGYAFEEILAALLLGSSRRLHRHPDLPPLQPISSFAYFVRVAREVYANGGLPGDQLVALHQTLFRTDPEPPVPGELPQPPPRER